MARHLRARFREPSAASLSSVEQSLRLNYFPRAIWGNVQHTTEQWLASPEGRRDLDDHLHRRLHAFRTQVVPWLNDAKSLQGARILEIGCGTGASTVALAEQGASVTAVDIDDASLAVARDRCAAYGVTCELLRENGERIAERVDLSRFDFIIFFACLEHMTHAERMRSMRATWSALRPGSLWCAVETPNRLWYFDEHTSRLPFFNWLPDELAFDCSRFSPREPFRNAYREISPAAMESFLRHGRGVSYHEFELAMKSAAELDVVSCLHLRLRRNGFLGWRALKRMRKRKHWYEFMLASERPDINRGFFLPYLDLIIRKD